MGTYSPVPVAPIPVDCWFAGNLVSGIFAAIRVQFQLIAYELIYRYAKKIGQLDCQFQRGLALTSFYPAQVGGTRVSQRIGKVLETHPPLLAE